MRLRGLVVLLASLAAPPALAQGRDVCICLQCMTGPYDRFAMPGGDMKPTIEPGQCVIVKMAPGTVDAPQAGDLIVFSKALDPGNLLPQDDSIRYLKRVAATGGQMVQMIGGKLHVDGDPAVLSRLADYPQILAPEGAAGVIPICPVAQPTGLGGTCMIPRYRETLPNGASQDILLFDPDPYFRDRRMGADTEPLVVPDGQFFVLGDNRDNSNDSRFPLSHGGFGTVPADHVVGIVSTIVPRR